MDKGGTSILLAPTHPTIASGYPWQEKCGGVIGDIHTIDQPTHNMNAARFATASLSAGESECACEINPRGHRRKGRFGHHIGVAFAIFKAFDGKSL